METFVKYLNTKNFLASSLAVALAACGGETEEPVEVVTPEPTPTAEFDPTTRDYMLSQAAQERRDEADLAAFRTEFAGYREELDGAPAEGGTVAATDAGDDPRAAMSWSDLDRDDDAHLTLAEYAIWAVPNGVEGAALSEEQEGKIVDSYFYYDQDGDGFISQREFTSARRGDDLG